MLLIVVPVPWRWRQDTTKESWLARLANGVLCFQPETLPQLDVDLQMHSHMCKCTHTHANTHEHMYAAHTFINMQMRKTSSLAAGLD